MPSVVENAVSVVQGNKEKAQSGDSGWIGGLVAGIIVIIVTAIFGFMAWSKGREMAKLLHEKAVKEEEEHQAIVDAKIAEDEEVIDAALDAADIARIEIEHLEAVRVVLEEEHAEIIKRINAITSWDDVDRFINTKPSSPGPTV